MLLDRRFAGTAAGIAQRVEAVSDIAPGFARYLLAYPFGGVEAEAALDRKTRALSAIAGLTVLGNDRQLRVQLAAAREQGCTAQEIVETITQMADYSGLTAVLNALTLAKRVFGLQPGEDDGI